MAKPSAAVPNQEAEVGYGKPPRHTRFKPGQSGNPKGRPKGTKNLKTDLMEELGEKIVVREGDRTQNISKQRAVIKTVVNRTLKGDTRAGNLLFSLISRLIDMGEEDETAPEPLNGDELEILRKFEERAVRKTLAVGARPERDSNVERRP